MSPEKQFERIFFHWTGLNGDTLKFPELRPGMKVEFDLKRDEVKKSWQAVKIEILENEHAK